MKAISLWQPWASLVVLGAKRIETRSWPTKYRGPLLIHAAKRKNLDELTELLCSWQFEELQAPLQEMRKTSGSIPPRDMSFGAIVGRVMLVDCRPTESFTDDELDARRGEPGHTWRERSLGNFAPGRFGWVLENPESFVPIPYRGSQGLFDVPLAGIVDRVYSQYSNKENAE